MSDGQVLSVSALTTAIRRNLEGGFPFVWVRGQVTNLARPSSGHLYFSLRDEQSSLSAVWFKNSQKAGETFDPLTGEVYEDGPRPGLASRLENGQELVCAGAITVYGARGVYQLVVEIARKAGLGRLHEEFERLRAKLAGLGYFAPERKRPLPPHPRRVAVITSPQGAAVHDFLRIAQHRGLAANIRIFPVSVQGDAAPQQLIAALGRVCDEGWAEVAVIIRGGGSIEDLWAFNDEGLARAVFHSPVPVLAGIGHEVDVTLADMTADLRAATPTHAAQLLWPAREELLRRIRNEDAALERAEAYALDRLHTGLRSLARELEWRSPLRLVRGWRQSLDSAFRLLQSAGRLCLEREEARISLCRNAIARTSFGLPVHFARVERLEQGLDRTVSQFFANRNLDLQKARQELGRTPERLPVREALFARLERQLANAGKALYTGWEHGLERAALRLEACNPHAPLERGYALVRKENGSFVKQTRDASPGEALRLVLRDGEVPVRVEEMEK